MKTFKFLGAMLATTALSAFLWDIIFIDRIYHCTDEVGLGYFSPGDWVHGELKRTTKVAEIAATSTMSDPDILHSNWSVGQLWGAWSAFLGSSLITSFTFAALSSRIASKNSDTQQTRAPEQEHPSNPQGQTN